MAEGHRHVWFEEQQTHHRYCMACGLHPGTKTCPDRPSGLWAMLRHPGWETHLRIDLDAPGTFTDYLPRHDA